MGVTMSRRRIQAEFQRRQEQLGAAAEAREMLKEAAKQRIEATKNESAKAEKKAKKARNDHGAQ